MIRTLVWKEYREHRLVWLTMMVVNCGALLGMLKLEEIISLRPVESKLLILGPVAALLVWGYGMICGAMLLAGEREEGTLNYLDTLPVSRFQLWLVKGQIGLILLGGQIVVLSVFLSGLRAWEVPILINGVDASPPVWPFALGMLFLGLVGMAYGLFFSARGENVLHTIGLAIAGTFFSLIAALFLSFAVLVLLFFILHWFDFRQMAGSISQERFQLFFTLTTFCGMSMAAAAGSARIFSRGDLQRRPVAVRRMRARASLAASWLRILWLCYRQMHRLVLGILTFALGLGVLFLVTGPFLWPVATLFLGVLCGVTVFSDEQIGGSFRFLGEQRFPLGRIWLLKTALRFGLLLLASFLILVPSLVVALYHSGEHPPNQPKGLLIISETLHLNLIVEVIPLGSYLLMWQLYGFCAGQLCGLLSRKTIVAAMIALMLSALLAVLWLPSLAGIGLHFWQVAGPPLILLAVGAFLMRAWAADRLASLKTYLGISAALVAALLWITYGIWYRVAEIPDVPESFDVAAYKASLPTMEENEAGRVIRGAWSHVASAMDDLFNSRDKKKPLGPELAKVLEDGWPDGPSKLGEWMDTTFAQEWPRSLALLPDLPLGMVFDPRTLTLNDVWFNDVFVRKLRHAISFSDVLAARGLQQQGRGDSAMFVENMRISLALSRNLQHHAPPHLAAFEVRPLVKLWSSAVDLWLKKLRGRPDLLGRALQALIDYETRQSDDGEHFRAAYVIAQNTLELPERMLNGMAEHRANANDSAELQTIAMLWLVPWEQTRHQRLLRVEFAGTEIEQRKSRLEWGGNVFEVFSVFGRFRTIQTPRELADLRACQLKLALRLYQEENGNLPDSLDALVPRYLKSVPQDPFGGQPFHYRRSRGEWIVWPKPIAPASNPPPGMAAAPDEVPVMPRADDADAPAKPRMPEVAPMFDRMVDHAPPENAPFMPRAEEAERPPRRPVANGQAGGGLPTFRFVPKGQAILWSVGDDGHDDGAREQSINMQFSSLGQDLIYLVPPPS